MHFLCDEGGAPEDGVPPRVLRVREVLSLRQASQNAQGNAAQLRLVDIPSGPHSSDSNNRP